MSSRSQQLGLLLAVAVALYVPHRFHNQMLAQVEADTAAGRAELERLTEAGRAQQAELAKVAAARADVEAELQKVTEARTASEAQLAAEQAGDCGVKAIEDQFAAKQEEEHSKVVAGAAPRLHQLQLEAETLRHGAQEEELELEAALPALQAQEEELRRAALARRTEVALGQELRDNDSAFVKQWMERVTTMDLFTGPFMVNKANSPVVDHGILIPRWQGQVENIGKASAELLEALPKMDPFLRPHPVLYRKCAVVGSSGLLLYYASGAAIDEHDAVVRFNAATTQGFEDFVGSKTTVRFADRANFAFSEKPTELVMQLVTNTHTLSKFVQHKKDDPESRVFMVSPEFHLHAIGDLNGPATPAFYGALFALQRCERVSLYGFTRPNSKDTPYHYYNAEEPEADELDRERREAALLKELLRNSGGRARVAEPCVMEEDCEAENSCQNCALGSRCECGNIMPVARPGYCMEAGVADCFYACDDPSACPGGASHTECNGIAHDSKCA
eukprot:jgi/Tetstr1/421980/TSEL_001226.t1